MSPEFQILLTKALGVGLGGLLLASFFYITVPTAVRQVADIVRRVRNGGFLAVVFLSVFVGGMILYGGSKGDPTNSPPPLLQMTLPQSGGNALAGDPALSGIRFREQMWTGPDSNSLARVEKWFRRGAWDDGQIMYFDDDWHFPYDGEHLSSVEIWAQGQIYPSEKSPDPIVSLVTPLALKPGETEVFCGRTADNSYRIEWRNAHPNRDAGQLADAAIELCRNGDCVVTENGVTHVVPYDVPFPHDGFGQDADWVRANFTNADEILFTGYGNWVDGQIGIGETNGLYKFTAYFAEDPPEATELYVGDYTVAVTNAGEYVFVLEKGAEYEFGTWPPAADVEYWAQDDMGEDAPLLMSWRGYWNSFGTWTEDGGWSWLYYPETFLGDYYPGYCRWLPTLRGSPDVQHLGPGDFPMTFEAVLTDYPVGKALPTFSWSTTDGNIRIHSPHSRQTQVSADSLPSWDVFELSVTAAFCNDTLCSHLTLHYGIHETPQVHLSASVPDTLLLVDDWMPGSQSAMAHVAVHSDIETNGSLRVSATSGADKVSVENSVLGEHSFSGTRDYGLDFTIDGIRTSDAVGDILLSFEFIDADGNAALSDTKRVTVVHPVSISLPEANNGLAVVKNSSITANLNVLPSVQELTVEWLTARRKTESVYDPWVIVQTGTTEESLLMQTSGVFALQARVICGTQSNRVEYLHTKTEPYSNTIHDDIGPCEAGMLNHIGVTSSIAQLNLRNAALAHLGNMEYTYKNSLPARNGFSRVSSSKWKCNAFVADVIIEAGLSVPIQYRVPHTWPIPDGTYPPVANDWATGRIPISGWTFAGTNCYPEPGFIAGHPNLGGLGHVGIVDYDGWTISARANGISRNAQKMLDGTCGYHKPDEE